MSPSTSAKALPERTSFSLRRHFDEAIVVVREHGGPIDSPRLLRQWRWWEVCFELGALSAGRIDRRGWFLTKNGGLAGERRDIDDRGPPFLTA